MGKQPEMISMKKETKKQDTESYAGNAIPAPFARFARGRKKRYGININRTIADALVFALANKEEWTKNLD